MGVTFPNRLSILQEYNPMGMVEASMTDVVSMGFPLRSCWPRLLPAADEPTVLENLFGAVTGNRAQTNIMRMNRCILFIMRKDTYKNKKEKLS